jgi:hypothetical protein
MLAFRQVRMGSRSTGTNCRHARRKWKVKPVSKPIRQHWVPRFYLRQFASPESKARREQVWAISRDKAAPPEPIRPTVESVALEKLLYSPLLPNGSRDFAVEKKLSELEGTLAGIWHHFSGQQVVCSEGMQKALALFLSTLYLRHPDQRLNAAETHRRMVKQVESIIALLETTPTHFACLVNGTEFQVPIGEFDKFKNSGENDHHRAFVDNILDTGTYLAESLLKKRWSFIVAEKPAFVTSDNPISLRGPSDTDRTFGFRTNGMTVYFPISPFVLLHLSDGEGIYVCPLSFNPEIPCRPWAPFNWETWTNASRFMFCPHDPYVVLREIMDFHNLAHSVPITAALELLGGQQ